MKKTTLIGLTAVVALLIASVSYACWGGWGMGYNGAGMDTATMQKFQSETLPLRNELMTKRFELQKEYNQPAPDTNRITDLRKEIIDLQSQLQNAATGYGFSGGPAWGGMMGSGNMMDMCPMDW